MTSLGSVPTDIFVILAIFIALFIWTKMKGFNGPVALLVSLIASTALFNAFPYENLLASSPFLPLAVFIALAGALTYALSGIISIFSFQGGVMDWLKTAALAFLLTALIVGISYHVVSIAPLYTWSGAVDFVFKPDAYFFWLLLAPFGLLLLL